MNLASLLLRPATSHPGAPALRCDDRVLGYADLADRVARLADLMAADGVDPDTRVAVLAANEEAFVVAYLASLWTGAVAVPLNPHAPAAELRRELSEVEPRVIVCGPGCAELAAEAADSQVLRALDNECDAIADRPLLPLVERSDDDLAVLLFTAGTAGAPKAAMLTHANLVSNIAQVQDHPGLRIHRDDVGLGVLPLFHVFGLNVVLGTALAAGACTVLVREFHPVDTATTVARRRATVVAGVPSMFAAWLDADPDAVPADSFASVRLAVSGAAALPGAVVEGFRTRFGVVVHEGYGLTEASPIVTTSAVEARLRIGSIGPPLPGVSVRLVDVDGVDAVAGDPGEVWVHGPNVFPGYWRDEEATRRVLTPDGWLRTGDVAVADDDGFLALVDRAKDLVIVAGFNVYPAEVEDVLREHPGVDDVAVLGVPDARTGEALAAYVVAGSGAPPDPAALRAFVAERLARYKVPATVELVDELPRNRLGKVLRRALRDSER